MPDLYVAVYVAGGTAQGGFASIEAAWEWAVEHFCDSCRTAYHTPGAKAGGCSDEWAVVSEATWDELGHDPMGAFCADLRKSNWRVLHAPGEGAGA